MRTSAAGIEQNDPLLSPIAAALASYARLRIRQAMRPGEFAPAGKSADAAQGAMQGGAAFEAPAGGVSPDGGGGGGDA